MIDLEEPEHHIDQRARIAASDLHAVAGFRPMGATDRHRPRPIGQRRTALAVFGALGVAAVVIAGLVWIGDRSADERPTTPDGQPVWTIGDLPQGYALTMWTGGQAFDSTEQPRLLVFGAGGPGDAAVVVYGPRSADEPSSEQRIPFAATDLEESTVSGRRVVSGTTPNGLQFASVEVGSRWLSITAQLVTESTMQWFAERVELDETGALTLTDWEPPERLRLLGAGDLTDLTVATFALQSAQRAVFDDNAPTASGVDDSLALIVAPSSSADQIMFALTNGTPTPVDLGGVTGWIAPESVNLDGGRTLLLQRDEQVFVISSRRPIEELITAAKSIRLATPAEYEAMKATRLGLPPAEPEGTTPVAPADTVATEIETADTYETGDEPNDTVPPATMAVDAVIIDVPLTLRRDASTDNQMTVSGTLPDGYTFEVEVVVAAGQAVIRSSNGAGVSFDLDRMGTEPQFNPLPDGRGWFVVTRDPDVTAFELTRSNGERYTVSLMATDAYPGVRFGAIGAPSGEVISARTIDRNGATVDEALI